MAKICVSIYLTSALTTNGISNNIAVYVCVCVCVNISSLPFFPLNASLLFTLTLF